jgi:hypothetical protein
VLPTIEAEWAATQAAADELEAELPFPLSDVLAATVRALEPRPFRQRVAEVAPLVSDLPWSPCD